jgi:hypothetical protein
MTKRVSEAGIGLISILGLTLLYHLFFFNRSFPIQEGWFSLYAKYLEMGRMPYRDFYLFLPPLYPLKIEALMRLFGDGLLVFRVYALVERLLVVALAYRLFLKFATPRTAFLATFFSLFLYAGAPVDVIYSYYQTCLLLSLLAGHFMLQAVEKDSWPWMWISLSGFMAGLAFMCKQSTGLFVLAALPVLLLVLLRGRGTMKILKMLGTYLAFSFLAVAPFLFWIHYNGAFGPFLSQVFLGGAASKGTLTGLLFGFLKITFSAKYLPWYILFLAACRRMSCAEDAAGGLAQTAPAEPGWGLLNALGVLAITVPLFLPRLSSIPYAATGFSYLKGIVINSSFIFVLAYCAWYLITAGNRDTAPRGKALFLTAGISVAIMYAHGMSYALEEHAAFPAVGIIVCLLAGLPSLAGKAARYILLSGIMLFAALSASAKYAAPYAWWGWREADISNTTGKLEFPEGRGFCVSAYTATVLSDITSIIKTHTTPADSIYTFPNIPLFYFLTQRYPTTFALVHYFDVCPDRIAKADAERLAAAPPKIIVSLEFLEATWKFHEDTFRHGARSGQRDIAEVITRLTASKLYSLKRSYLTPGGDRLKVWVRL